MSPMIIERAAEAAWNLKANRPWAEIPEEWKPFYRDQMRAALEATGLVLIVHDEIICLLPDQPTRRTS